MNFKELINRKKIADSERADKLGKRIEDMRSGGSGSMRSSIFRRNDEALTNEMIEAFKKEFEKTQPYKVSGGRAKGDTRKNVCSVKLTLPDVVKVNGVDVLLAKVDYNKDNREFKAYYRPKNGRWGQAQTVDEEV